MVTNAELRDIRAQAVPRGVASATGIFAMRAENSEIWDQDGRRFIDFAGGIAVLNVGHRHRARGERAGDQPGKQQHRQMRHRPLPSVKDKDEEL